MEDKPNNHLPLSRYIVKVPLVGFVLCTVYGCNDSEAKVAAANQYQTNKYDRMLLPVFDMNLDSEPEVIARALAGEEGQPMCSIVDCPNCGLVRKEI